MSRHPHLPLLFAALLIGLLPWGCQCGPNHTGHDGSVDAGDGGPDTGDAGDAGAQCGDNVREGGEACDDGDTVPGDGCSASCTIENGWSCPDGGPCVEIAECGNEVVESGEACDDGDTASDDGCSSTCALEPGWTCGTSGTSCSAASCGDGILAGAEVCDDGTPGGGDGCSDSCQLEEGFKCPVEGSPCEPTTCGDGVPEGTEACDDGDNDLGDGCTPLCSLEPVCSDGTCTPFCGDGVILPGSTTEACDDGNTRAGDGCSPTCTVEPGFECELVTESPPETIEIPVVYRDFRGWDLDGGHEDFEDKTGGREAGLVEDTLDAEGKPVFLKAGINLSTAENFAQWYRDVPGVNIPVTSTLVFTRQGDGSYVFDDQFFFPIDGDGWVALGEELLRDDNDADSVADRNFSFTSEVRYWFEYKGTEVLSFRGDDDVWVFINDRLAVDIGGLHSAENGSVTLADAAGTLGLEVGKIYEVVVFQAERHTTASSYKLTLSNFEAARSECTNLCGNGEIDTGEECDDGNTDDEDTCNNSCRLSCQALEESCTPTQGCCSGLICLDSNFNECDGTTACSCEPTFGARPNPGGR